MPGQDWLPDIIVCPECGGPLSFDKTDSGWITCPNDACQYSSRRAGRVCNLLPRRLDEFQQAENDFRLEIYDKYAAASPSVSEAQLGTFQLLNILCYHTVTSQYFFFRDFFSRKHQLKGRGLEIGGGTGQASGFIKLFYPGTEMVTSDVAPVNMHLAQEMAVRLCLGTDYFVMADAERLPFAKHSFDFLFCSSMLHHLGNLDRALQQGRSVLRDGGTWYVINELSLGAALRLYWNSSLGTKGKLGRLWRVHENSYTFREWTSAFERNGLAVVDVHFPRNPKHKLLNWQRGLYYVVLSHLPVGLLRMGVPCEVNFVLRKTG